MIFYLLYRLFKAYHIKSNLLIVVQAHLKKILLYHFKKVASVILQFLLSVTTMVAQEKKHIL